MLSTLGVLATEKEKEFKKFEEFEEEDPGARIQETGDARSDSRLEGSRFGGARLPNRLITFAED